MDDNHIFNVFVVDRETQVKGIITIDDARKEIKEKKALMDVLRTDITIVLEDEYINDLIPKALESTFPLAVVNEEKKLVGFILRVHVLSGLVAEDIEESAEYHV